MKYPLLEITNDYVFKRVFGDSKDVLLDFIKSVIVLQDNDKIEDIEILDPFVRGDYFDAKVGILDIKVKARVKTKNNLLIDIEMQVLNHKGFLKRIQFYLSKIFINEAKEGDNYEALPKAISIIVTKFTLFNKGTKCFHRFRFYDPDDNLEFPTSNEIYTIELPKFNKDKSHIDSRNWISFINSKTEEEFMEAAQNSPFIEKAYAVLKKISGDKVSRIQAEARERALNNMADLYASGKEDGIKEGKIERDLEVVANLLKMNFSIETMSSVLNMSIDDTKKLIAQIQ